MNKCSTIIRLAGIRSLSPDIKPRNCPRFISVSSSRRQTSDGHHRQPEGSDSKEIAALSAKELLEKEYPIEKGYPNYFPDAKSNNNIPYREPEKLPPLPRTRDLLHVYGIKAKSNLSQNFLLNQKLLRGLVRAAGVRPGYRVVEVGPGPGNLTRAILERSPFEVLAIEKDRRFLPLLEQLADSVLPGQLKILLGDALDHNFDSIFGDPSKHELPDGLPGTVVNFRRDWNDKDDPYIRVIGNLPFSVSTALLIKWLHEISLRKSFWVYGRVPMLLTFQKEVARRICAKPASAERSRLSVMSQNYCSVDYKFTISGRSFTPEAGVDTGVVRFSPHRKPHCTVPFKLFEKFVAHLFHHRNHNLEYNYKTLFPRDMHELACESFDRAQVNPRIYPYMISNREAARLCEVYYEHCQRIPSLPDFNYRASKRLLSESSMKVLQEAGLSLLS